MASTNPAVAIFRFDNLGTAATVDQRIFPLAYYEEDGNLNKGSYLIKATLEEMEEIAKLGIDLNKNEDFIYNTRLKLEDLQEKKEKLEDNRKTRNPITAFLNYRAAWLFHAGSRALYRQTIRTSEKIHREERRVRVVSSTQMPITNDAVSPDAMIDGFVVDLPNGLNDTARRTINDATATMATAGPFQDNPLVSQLRDDEQAITLPDAASLLTQDGGSGVDEGNQMSVASSDPQLSRPTSPPIINYFQIINSMVAANSNLSGPTVNTSSGASSRNSGASVTQEFAP